MIDAAVARLMESGRTAQPGEHLAARAEASTRVSGQIADLFVLKDLILENGGQLHDAVTLALDAVQLPRGGSPSEATALVDALHEYLPVAGLVSQTFGRPRTPEEWRDGALATAVDALAEAKNAVALHPEQARRSLTVARRYSDTAQSAASAAGRS